MGIMEQDIQYLRDHPDWDWLVRKATPGERVAPPAWTHYITARSDNPRTFFQFGIQVPDGDDPLPYARARVRAYATTQMRAIGRGGMISQKHASG